jgi:hypothetical protein
MYPFGLTRIEPVLANREAIDAPSASDHRHPFVEGFTVVAGVHRERDLGVVLWAGALAGVVAGARSGPGILACVVALGHEDRA